jgi:L-ascorbate metabolism protein UlaG (beta-lactamase superfamily)
MDPDTLAPLADRFPELPFIVPQAKLDTAKERIGTQANLMGVTAGDRFTPLPGLDLRVFPAAHETEERDADGNHLYLGYGLSAIASIGGQFSLYHSGDTIPFTALSDALADFAPDIALLPVNGRDAERLSAGVPGNMTLDEGARLCREAGVNHMIPHHFGMFAFNTLDEKFIDQAAAELAYPKVHKPKVGEAIILVG